MTEVILPYQNHSLRSIKGERWRSIKGFEGHYEISSLGRVKSLYRERVLYHGGIQPIRERILKIQLRKVRNHSVDDDLHTLMATLHLEGQKHYLSVGRLVYNAFVAPFDLDDSAVYISYKDGDGRNLNYRNLVMTNLSQMRNRSYEKGRYVSKLRKPVSQFTVDGKLVAQYGSHYEAARATGVEVRGISDAATGGVVLYKGFVWQSGKRKKIKKGSITASIDMGVNTELMKKTGIKSNQPQKIPAFNLSPENMEGEQWKAIPGYEGLYKVSNHGRIRALKKISTGAVQRWHPERIKLLTLVDHVNGKGGTLITTLSKDHKKKVISVARYVYFLFVARFDLANPALRIYLKDGNPVNLNAENLVLKNAAWSINRNNKRLAD
jgi:hypothetical protein